MSLQHDEALLSDGQLVDHLPEGFDLLPDANIYDPNDDVVIPPEENEFAYDFPLNKQSGNVMKGDVANYFQSSIIEDLNNEKNVIQDYSASHIESSFPGPQIVSGTSKNDDETSPIIVSLPKQEGRKKYKDNQIPSLELICDSQKIVITKYNCKFCKFSFDTVKNIQTHYLARHYHSKDSIDNRVCELTHEDSIDGKKVKKVEKITKRKKKPSLTVKSANISVRKSRKNNKEMNESEEEMEVNRVRRFPCDWPNCSYVAKYSIHLRDHKRTHTGEKPYRCTWADCHLGFTQRSALKAHFRTHTGERPYQCEWPGCSLLFAQKYNLTVHMRTHTGERPFMCDWPGCEWAFTLKGNLDEHKRLHSDDRNLICDFPNCCKRFSQMCYLRKHILGHKNVKPYACDYPDCNYRALRSHDIKTHLNTHTRLKNFLCTACGKRFSRQNHLNRHMANQHADQEDVDDFIVNTTNAAATNDVITDQEIAHENNIELNISTQPITTTIEEPVNATVLYTKDSNDSVPFFIQLSDCPGGGNGSMEVTKETFRSLFITFENLPELNE